MSRICVNCGNAKKASSHTICCDLILLSELIKKDVCATDRNMAIASVILQSDIDEKFLGVNKYILKGNCSYYGAVMNAKDGKTLWAHVIEKQEALEKLQTLSTSAMQKESVIRELNFYRCIFGY